MSSGVTGVISEIIIALVRSKAVYQAALSSGDRRAGRERHSHPCAIDLFAATTGMSSISHEIPSHLFKLSFRIVHFYSRLLLLRYYEVYYLRHDPEPIHLDESDRTASQDHPHILARHYRRLELVNSSTTCSDILDRLLLTKRARVRLMINIGGGFKVSLDRR